MLRLTLTMRLWPCFTSILTMILTKYLDKEEEKIYNIYQETNVKTCIKCSTAKSMILFDKNKSTGKQCLSEIIVVDFVLF